MTDFSALSSYYKNLLSLIMFFAALAQLILCIYKWICRRSIRHCSINIFLFGLTTVLLAILEASFDRKGNKLFLTIPWALLLAACGILFVHAAFCVFLEHRQSRKHLSPSSINEAFDNLDPGICFCDQTDRIILINHTMNRLISSVNGNAPQMLHEITTALADRRIKERSELYRFSEKAIYRFHTESLQVREMPGITQITAWDVTGLYDMSERLLADNERLSRLNEELGKMYARLADRIREQETLELKMRIHNEIGTSLIAISKIMNGDEANTDLQLQKLQHAVSYFSNDVLQEPESMDALLYKAEDMNFHIAIDGDVPTANESLITTAACVCMTNCINHAGGDSMNIIINKNTAIFTSNGRIPDEDITEGGGLTSLRRQVEQAGGQMSITSRPAFKLVITLP